MRYQSTQATRPARHVVTGVMVLSGEGRRCIPALKAMRQIVSTLYAIHDGPIDRATAEAAGECCERVLVWEKQGFKEAHLARFFHEFGSGDPWFLHLDSDEVLSEALICELKGLTFEDGRIYQSALEDIRDDGTILRYARHPRRYKTILFQRKSIDRVWGIPHVGIVVGEAPQQKLAEVVEHRSTQVNAGFLDYLIKKVIPFTQRDARARTDTIVCLHEDLLDRVAPDHPSLRRQDAMRYRLHAWMVPIVFSGMLRIGLVDLLHARNLAAVSYEFKRLLSNAVYQAHLCVLIGKYRGLR